MKPRNHSLKHVRETRRLHRDSLKPPFGLPLPWPPDQPKVSPLGLVEGSLGGGSGLSTPGCPGYCREILRSLPPVEELQLSERSRRVRPMKKMQVRILLRRRAATQGPQTHLPSRADGGCKRHRAWTLASWLTPGGVSHGWVLGVAGTASVAATRNYDLAQPFTGTSTLGQQ